MSGCVSHGKAVLIPAPRDAIHGQAAEIVFTPEHRERVSEKGRLSGARNLARPAGVCHRLIDKMAASELRRQRAARFRVLCERAQRQERRWRMGGRCRSDVGEEMACNKAMVSKRWV
jgi:hypothetical protein